MILNLQKVDASVEMKLSLPIVVSDVLLGHMKTVLGPFQFLLITIMVKKSVQLHRYHYYVNLYFHSQESTV